MTPDKGLVINANLQTCGAWGGCIKLTRTASRPDSQWPPMLPDFLIFCVRFEFVRAASRDGSRSARELDAALLQRRLALTRYGGSMC